MSIRASINLTNTLAVCALALTLQGCNRSFHDLGPPPALTSVDYDVPIDQVIVAPEPAVISGPQRFSMADNSIWRREEAGYFRDTRAFKVGDILTVNISIDDSARLNNTSERENSITGSLNTGGGVSVPIFGQLPGIKADGTIGGGLEYERGGSVNRTERINLQVAAAVINASPNGNLHIVGSQEVRVNHELRILTVQGFVRAKDILPNNTIPYEKIAEARITYGGVNSRRVPIPVKDWRLVRALRRGAHGVKSGANSYSGYDRSAGIYK